MSYLPQIDFSNDYTMFNKLLRMLYRFYPIGVEGMKNDYYEGFTEIKERLIDKIENQLNNPVSLCYLLEDALQKAFPTSKIENQNYYQFPSYTFSLQLSEFENDAIKVTTNLIMHISLLVDHYTLYFETVSYPKIEGKIASSFSIQFLDGSTNKMDIVNKIKQILSVVCPNKSYINHYLLKKNTITAGTPFGAVEDIRVKRNYTLFDFLFSNNEQDAGHLDILP